MPGPQLAAHENFSGLPPTLLCEALASTVNDSAPPVHAAGFCDVTVARQVGGVTSTQVPFTHESWPLQVLLRQQGWPTPPHASTVTVVHLVSCVRQGFSVTRRQTLCTVPAGPLQTN